MTQAALVSVFEELDTNVAPTHSVPSALRSIVAVAAGPLLCADAASLIRRGAKHSKTVASSSAMAAAADAVQLRLQVGPSMDACGFETPQVLSGDLLSDSRWPPPYRLLTAGQHGIRSAAAFRLTADTSSVTVLTLYALQRDAFDADARARIALFVAHVRALLSHRLAAEQAARLLDALESSREIGIAIGVLMHQHKITRDAAFAMLHDASQLSHRRLRQIARDVAETGHITTMRRSRGGDSRAVAGSEPQAEQRPDPCSP
ncbi:MAG: ANTAR domain-containing protein [Jatrophihabitans sp.]|uniref:ANTAR domain-containing protein n=1 Tax=Jatrophihabitans sp. TaxID=1932789 RepID=UPI003F80F2EE